MKYKAFIFDYDYTLAFSEPAILMCFRHIFEVFGFKNIPDEAIAKTIGMPLTDAISKLTGKDEPSLLEDMKRSFHLKADEVMNKYTVFYPPVEELLKAIKQRNGHIGIVSNKLRRRISEMFDMHGLIKSIDVIIGPEDISTYKPDPEGLLLAIDRLKVLKAETLYIGDSIIDAKTARNAGVDFVGVTTGTTTKEDFSKEPNIKIIKDLSELLED